MGQPQHRDHGAQNQSNDQRQGGNLKSDDKALHEPVEVFPR